jgi:GrpB-like predicted nucleotidyltransferase (UPF0157 family)
MAPPIRDPWPRGTQDLEATTIRSVSEIEIVGYDPSWPDAFLDVAGRLRTTVGDDAARIDHIGSTSVPGLAAKDVIDTQISIEREADLDRVARVLEESGWTPRPHIYRDHDVPGWPRDEPPPRKRFFQEPRGSRRVNLHVRVLGQPNQRYPLLFRDYLRAHPHSGQAYGTLKRDLALLLEDDPDRYPDVKDAACDLVYFAAEDWARAVSWDPGGSDA